VRRPKTRLLPSVSFAAATVMPYVLAGDGDGEIAAVNLHKGEGKLQDSGKLKGSRKVEKKK
jgi:hypothetical protein